jgi:hypothetical protein
MNINNIIKDKPGKDISSSDLTDIISYFISAIREVPVTETIEVGDWVISKVDERTFYVSEKYSNADMSRFMHDEFTKKKLIKNVDQI